jgi:hypothetical protein
MGEHRVSTPDEQRQNGNKQGFLGGILQGLSKIWSGSRMDVGQAEPEYSNSFGQSPQDKQMGQLIKDLGMGEKNQHGKMYEDYESMYRSEHDEDFNQEQMLNASLIGPLSGYLFELKQARDSGSWRTEDSSGKFNLTSPEVPGKNVTDEELMKIALDTAQQGYKQNTLMNPRLLQKEWSGRTAGGEVFDEELSDEVYDKWFARYGYGKEKGSSQQQNNIMEALIGLPR